MEYILTTKDLTKKYKKFKAVSKVNMHVEKGAIYGFIGRNGAGKTTFLKIISGLSSQTKGELTIMGKTGAELSSVRDKIGCLIEAPGIIPKMNAYDNIKMKCIAKGIHDKKYIEDLLTLVGLADTGKKPAKKFSLGMRQRLGIALALVGNPEMLVLDEPINGLDPQGIVEVRDLILKLNQERNITIIISSHILGELSKLCTHYGIINQGKLMIELSNEELIDKCSSKLDIEVSDTDKAIGVINELGIAKYKVTSTNHIELFENIEDSALINERLVKSGVAVSELSKNNEDLENYFIRLTGGEEEDD